MKVKQNPVRRSRFGRLVLACAVTLALGATACGSDPATDGASSSSTESTALAPDGGDPVDGGSLVVGIQNDVTGWNPTADTWGTAAAFAGSTLLESLTTLDAEGNVEPWLATSWEPNSDYTSWTLTLREGVMFHDGQPFDAEAVKANFDDVLASPLTGIALGGAIESATVVGDQVRIDLSAPWAAFPSSFLAGPNAWMRAPAMLGPDANGSANPIGTGPFKFASWEPGASLKVVKFPDYWREGEPHLDEIDFTPIADDISRVNSLQSGDIDMMVTTSARDAADVEDEYTVIRDWDTETTLLIANTRETASGEPNPLSNEHARKAIAYATDPKVIAGLVGDDLEIPTSPFSDDTPWADPKMAASYPGFDQTKAREEVEAYKRDTGEATLTVNVLGSSDTGTVAILQALEQQWAEAGIETEIEALEHSAYSLQGVQGKFQLIFGPIFSAPDPDQNYHFWSSSTVAEDGAIGINFSAFATDSSQAALVRGRESKDFEERKAAYADLIAEQNAAAVNIWLYFTPYSLVASDRVHGLQEASEVPFGNFQPKTWWGQVWVTE